MINHDQSSDQSVDQSSNQSSQQPADQFSDHVVGNLVGRLVGRLVGALVGRLVRRLVLIGKADWSFAMVTKDEITGEWICSNSDKVVQKAGVQSIEEYIQIKEDKKQ
jgi:hypothetical protein